uniref:reductase for protein n=1 Tax=Streptomyces clavuligerus TaxID=1901 RepID=UPI0025812012|nr:Chain A, reductase for protein [Streptomyces clavuligerus]7Y8L_B Chain B, reductase for protein [Streptomyces clavuligerus]7Y8L_C Chain C, reductase for protein [Streptomyces clavuligerus]7Y8L_D Chain D, reductase for protein [Streptomyces clavuligerus]7Y8M_A Chain A, reductase [Streptomyces clavuligerus]7Y8M_B Chain B, reductase [Streptomyces clavuligerus]7Y8M_C Chain C, reductase [Streptomyces clavuligerus]7Y8M_D Chain D, reductase [Streptomyces clavuligerus]
MSRPAPLTLIGLGPMGQAMGNALLDRGHGLTVWNRTASRADALVERGAVRAPDVAAAVAANELVVLSLTDYDAMYALLGPAADALAGKVVVNLSSDTPEKTRAGARWIAEHGGTLIAGGVTCPPSGIGSPESSAFYSGPSAAFERHRETLRTLTRTDYRGEDPGLAALWYQIGMVMWWNAMLGYLQAVALADANGLKAADILPHASDTVAGLPFFLRFYADRIDTGHHGGDADRLAMGTASVEHILHTMADSGVDTALPEAVVAFFRRGEAAGYAENSFSSMVELLKKPS